MFCKEIVLADKYKYFLKVFKIKSFFLPMCHLFLYFCLVVSIIEVKVIARLIMLVAVYRKPLVTVTLALEPGWETEFLPKTAHYIVINI
jgi:hypothetical protein